MYQHTYFQLWVSENCDFLQNDLCRTVKLLGGLVVKSLVFKVTVILNQIMFIYMIFII